MWCSKRLGKYQGCTRIPDRRRYNQVFQDWIFLVDGHDDLLQIWNRHHTAMRRTRSRCLSANIIPPSCSAVMSPLLAKSMSLEGGVNGHACNRRAICTDEAYTQVGRRPKY